MSTASVVELWLVLNNAAVLALSIPLDKCLTLSVNPLKWLRFLGYSIYGQQGYLSMSPTGPPLSDYTAHVEAYPYYFISEDEPLFADVDAIDGRTSNSSVLPDCREDFRDKIIERDGTCVFTNEMADLCDACHILPHSKGNNYIANVLRYRDHAGELDGIDDIKNGLLLWPPIHLSLGSGALAFLKTPNMYLSVNDIPRNVRTEENQTIATNRITVHHIVDSGLGILLPPIVPNNSDVREPADTSEWPPAVIINTLYTSAVLQAWAPESFQQTMRTMTNEIYYNSDGSHYEQGDIDRSNSATRERLYRRNMKKARAEETSLANLMYDVMAFRMRSARQQLEGKPAKNH